MTIKGNVEVLLGKYPECRNDDTFLMLAYWKAFDQINVRSNDFPENVLAHGTSPMSIIRARQKLQSDGLYPADEDTQLRRSKKEAKFCESIAKYGEIPE